MATIESPTLPEIDYALPENNRRLRDDGPGAVGLVEDRRKSPASLTSASDLHGLDEQFLNVALLNVNRIRERPTLVRHYVGITALGSHIINPELYIQAGRLRAHTYIDEMHFLTPDNRRSDGTETDDDDMRSIHVAVAKVNGADPVSIIGNMRLIKKRNDDDLLPVERLFDIPEAASGSLEVSRFIARDQDRRLQALASLAMMRTACCLAMYENTAYAYAVVEEPFFRRFQAIGLPFRKISDGQWLEEYKSVNYAAQIATEELLPALRDKDARLAREDNAVAPFFEKAQGNLGLGYFGDRF